MKLRDTPTRYGLISRLLHWGIAALLAWQLAGMIVKIVVGRAPITAFWVGSHVSIGSLLLVLILMRAIWALRERKQRPPYESGPSGLFAKVGHLALYALVLVVPSLALMRLIGGERPISVFGIHLRAARERPVEWITAPADLLHGALAWTLFVLILGHIAMAVLHRYWWQDDTLARMAGKSKD
ncbi:cytochrome b [Altericroceibacterium spongiae]|uniref:Cytochrome b n=1 Tax=Altericroceibacterium spongiae TaxID=2320269 RepID=A0A420E9H9_9SPHN|nr:cytochrome b [Altericroceibacterium spongiae]RKF15994.1 cytochrome b [Altericroceibacterium spongiae]